MVFPRTIFAAVLLFASTDQQSCEGDEERDNDSECVFGCEGACDDGSTCDCQGDYEDCLDDCPTCGEMCAKAKDACERRCV